MLQKNQTSATTHTKRFISVRYLLRIVLWVFVGCGSGRRLLFAFPSFDVSTGAGSGSGKKVIGET
jgi:hypothetical protein